MNKNKRQNGITLLGLLIIIMAILLVITVTALIICINSKNGATENIANYDINNKIENKLNNNVFNETKSQNNINNQANVTEIATTHNSNEKSSNVIKPIKLNVTDKETMMGGGEILHINDYEIIVPDSFVKAGYEIVEDGDTLNIKVNDGSYECILIQLSDSYVMPTEEEIDGFYETEEYKMWDEADVDYDDEEALELHYDKYDEISTKYYKSLGYTPQDCPDYTLTSEELEPLIGKYLIDRNDHSSGNNNLFPGYYSYRNYDWGRMKLYTIPKYYHDSDFGEDTSDFSICLYMFEYYDTNDMSIDDLSLITY